MDKVERWSGWVVSRGFNVLEEKIEEEAGS